MASEQFATVLAILRSRPPLAGDVGAMRAALESVSASPPEGTRVTPIQAGGVTGEWVAAPDAGQSAVLYLHGGGYVIGSPRTHRDLAARISQASGARLLVIDYRLAPEHPFPAALDDALTAYRWLLDQGIPPAAIGIAGDSAGGGLTLATLLRLRDEGVPLPACAVTLSAWTDLALTGTSLTSRADTDPIVTREGLREMAAHYVGTNTRDPYASPLYADLAGLPPLLMQVGDAETLLDDTLRVAEKIRQTGGTVELEVYPEMIHVFQAFAVLLPEGQQAIRRIGAFLAAHLQAPAPA